MSSNVTERLLVVGAGGFAREVAWLVEAIRRATGRNIVVVGYADDAPGAAGGTLGGVPVTTIEQSSDTVSATCFAVAVGSPSDRARLVARALAAGLVPATLVHPRVEMSDTVSIGHGAIVCAGSILTVNIAVGAHVHVNLDCTIGHDVHLGDFATLAPGVHVSGNVHVGPLTYVGTGAVIINGTAAEPLLVGEGSTIGAGACVVKTVPPGATVVGVPARPRS